MKPRTRSRPMNTPTRSGYSAGPRLNPSNEQIRAMLRAMEREVDRAMMKSDHPMRVTKPASDEQKR